MGKGKIVQGKEITRFTDWLAANDVKPDEVGVQHLVFMFL
jgi:hypothetical protein